MKNLYIYGALLVGFLIQLSTAKLADYITPCSAKDPKLNDCVVKQARTLYPFLVNGIKEFGILPLEPLFIPLMRMDEGQAGVVGITFNVSDSKHYGFKDMKIDSARIDPINYRFEINVTFPAYSVIGDYEVKGRILVLPIVGTGFTNMTFLNYRKLMSFEGIPEQRNGKTYLKLKDVQVKLRTTRVLVRMDNLFGNKQLSDSMNKVLNDNSLDAFAQMQPAFEDIFSGIYAELLGRLFHKIPLNQLFKDLQ